MATYTDVQTTETDMDAAIGFSFADFQAAFGTTDQTLSSAMLAADSLDPIEVGLNNETNPLKATEAWADFSNGLHIWAVGKASATIATLSEVSADLTSNGKKYESWITGKATAYITSSLQDTPEFDLVKIQSVKDIGFSVHDAVTDALNVAMIWGGTKLTFANYAVGGTATSLKIILPNNATTETTDGYYLTLKGSFTPSISSMSGKITSYEYGTVAGIASDSDEEAQFSKQGEATRISMNAATTMATILSSGSFDSLSAGKYSGNDVIGGTDGADSILAGDGNDKVGGLAGNDLLKGQAGNDTLEGGAGADTLNGGTGNDKIYGYSAASVEHSEDGNNHINGWSGNDILYCGGGNDNVNGGAGSDKIYGGSGDDSIGGDLNPAYLADYGIDATSTEYTGYGNDIIDGGAGNDTINGGGGNDKLTGGEGDDELYGDRSTDPVEYSGNDSLDGGNGNDYLWGGRGNDKLLGGAGNDSMSAGYGDDILTGGDGADYFLMNSTIANNGIDKITDFKSGEDKLWFYTFYYVTAEGAALTVDNFTTETTPGADDYLIYSQGKLYYDADANGSEEKILIAQVSGLTVDDLVFGTSY